MPGFFFGLEGFLPSETESQVGLKLRTIQIAVEWHSNLCSDAVSLLSPRLTDQLVHRVKEAIRIPDLHRIANPWSRIARRQACAGTSGRL